MAPWTARDAHLTGRFVPVSAWGWVPFYDGSKCSKRMLRWGDLWVVDNQTEEHQHRVIVEEIQRDPLGHFDRGLAGIIFSWFRTPGPKMRMGSLVVHLPLMVLFGFGITRMRRQYSEAFARALPALGIIVFVNIFQTFVFPHVRYMSAEIAVSFVFGALPLVDLLEGNRA